MPKVDYAKEFETIVENLESGDRSVFEGKDASFLVVSGNRVLARNSAKGLDVEVSEKEDGVEVSLTVDDDTMLTSPVHLCFGIVHKTGTQKIRARYRIGNNVKIGKDCLIHANAVVYDHCVLGDGCVLQSGSVIGADGYYFQKRKGETLKFNSVGRVILGNHVEIGANTTIDKGVTGDTLVGDYTKFDNHVQVGHDTQIGRYCLIGAFTAMCWEMIARQPP